MNFSLIFHKKKIYDLEDQMKDYTKLKEYSSNKISEFTELKNEHQREIEKLKKENEKIIIDKISQVKLIFSKNLILLFLLVEFRLKCLSCILFLFSLDSSRL